MTDSLQTASTGSAHPRIAADHSTKALRSLYYARFAFAIVWAILMLAIGKSINPGVIALLLVYPLFDVTAAVIDFRSSGTDRPKSPLLINMGLSLLTAVGLGVAVASGIPAVLRVWGAWAITAGIVQLIVAILRYRLGGQWPMILSGGISVVAGSTFIAMAGGPKASLTSIAGYAVLGGVFFLISAIRLHRLAAKSQ